jgi:sporulation protein YlmC with PRC-barrel domain
MLGLEEIIGLEVISSDARVVGTVEGVGLNLQDWTIPVIRVGLRRGIEDLLGKKRRLLAVEKVNVRTEEIESVSDTIIMRKPLDLIGEAIVAESDDIMTAGALMGMRVICSNARHVGLVDNLIFDPQQGWKVCFLQVKLDREAVDALSMRHNLLSSPVVGIQTSDVRAIGDMVMMAITIEELRAFLESRQPKVVFPPPDAAPAEPESSAEAPASGPDHSP